MVKYTIYIKVAMENVETLYFNSEEYIWNLMLKCLNCDGIYKNYQTLCKSIAKPQHAGQGYIHYSSKCKVCNLDSSISIVEGSMQPYNANIEGFQPIVTFECRGVQVLGIRPGAGWIIQTKQNNIVDSHISVDEANAGNSENSDFQYFGIWSDIRRS